MRCAVYVLVGAIMAPLIAAAGVAFIAMPILMARHYGLSELWGLAAEVAVIGGSVGAAVCRDS